MITINGCRIGKKGIRDTRGNYYPVRFDRGELISTKADAVTIRAKSTLAGLPRELFPQNDSDSREDYFERDRAASTPVPRNTSLLLMKIPPISYAFNTPKCTFEPVSIDREALSKKAFFGVYPILWKAIKQKLGRLDGGFVIQDAEKGILLLSDIEIEECLCLE